MIGNYFRNGKTIVIDDQYDEAKPLLDSLYKLQIPHYYSDGKQNSEKYPLPNKSNHFRLVFLDLNLWPQLTSGEDYKNFRAGHTQILETILNNVNHSYILIIWSQEEETYKDQHERIFDSSESYHTLKKPYKCISLQKTDYFSDDGKGGKTFIDQKKENQLYKKISNELQELEAFTIFCDWESKINDSAGEAIDSLLQTVNEFDQNNKEKNLHKLLTLLAVSYAGLDGFLSLNDDQEKTDAVLLALNEILHDDIDRLVLNRREKGFQSWSVTEQEYEKAKNQLGNIKSSLNVSNINTKLLTYSPNKPELTGSVYRVKKLVDVRAFFDKSVRESKINSEQKDSYKNENDGQGPSQEILKEMIQHFKKRLFKRVIPIELNITPLCDISQGKDPLHRLVPGFIIEKSDKKYFNEGDYSYATKVFSGRGLLENFDRDIYILLDFRYLKSIGKHSVKQRTKDSSTLPRYLFTLRKNLINDIQVHLSGHINRLGVMDL